MSSVEKKGLRRSESAESKNEVPQGLRRIDPKIFKTEQSQWSENFNSSTANLSHLNETDNSPDLKASNTVLAMPIPKKALRRYFNPDDSSNTNNENVNRQMSKEPAKGKGLKRSFVVSDVLLPTAEATSPDAEIGKADEQSSHVQSSSRAGLKRSFNNTALLENPNNGNIVEKDAIGEDYLSPLFHKDAVTLNSENPKPAGLKRNYSIILEAPNEENIPIEQEMSNETLAVEMPRMDLPPLQLASFTEQEEKIECHIKEDEPINLAKILSMLEGQSTGIARNLAHMIRSATTEFNPDYDRKRAELFAVNETDGGMKYKHVIRRKCWAVYCWNSGYHGHPKNTARYLVDLEAVAAKTIEAHNYWLHRSQEKISFKQKTTKMVSSMYTGIKENFQVVNPWIVTLKSIEGNYGMDTRAYFSFVKWIFFLNCFISLLVVLFIIVPGAVSDQKLCNTPFPSIENYLLTNVTYNADCVELICSVEDGEKWYESLFDFLSGTGWMADKILFIGKYVSAVLIGGKNFIIYELNLAYLLTTLSYLFLSWLFMTFSVIQGAKSSAPLLADMNDKYFVHIFAKWDYCIRNNGLSTLKHKLSCRSLKNELAYDKDRSRRTNRTTKQNVLLIFCRMFVAFLNIVLIFGSFALIYYVITKSSEHQNIGGILSLVAEYLPSVTITFLNLVIPEIMQILDPLEDYSVPVQLRLILIKSVFLRLSSLIVLLLTVIAQINSCSSNTPTTSPTTTFDTVSSSAVVAQFVEDRSSMFLSNTIQQLTFADATSTISDSDKFSTTSHFISTTSPLSSSYTSAPISTGTNASYLDVCTVNAQCQCWESYIGQQFYKLAVLNFVVLIATLFLVEYPRRIIVTGYESTVTKMVGKPKFEIPSNVLDLIYEQTVCWLGSVFCPFLPLIATVHILFVFYLKQVTLAKNCDFSQKPYRAAKTQSYFTLVLMVSFFLCLTVVIYLFVRMTPSEFCGPFRSMSSIWSVVEISVLNSWPVWLQNLFWIIAKPPFILLLFFLLGLIFFYYYAMAAARQDMLQKMSQITYIVSKSIPLNSYYRLVVVIIALCTENRDRMYLMEKIYNLSRGNHTTI